MRRWQSYYEILFFPLVLLYIASVLKGISSMLLSPNFQLFFKVENEWVIQFAEMFRYLGYYITQLFPFLVLVKILSRRYEDSVPVFIGVVSYVLLNVTTMFFSKGTLQSFFYFPELGLQIDSSTLSAGGSGMRYPIALGILAVFISALLTRYFYTRSRKSPATGSFSFINRDASALIYTGITTILIGIAIAYVWPYLINVLNEAFRFISEDIGNPINLFVYGCLEKILTVLDLDSLLHSRFWFGEYGGSWINNSVVYFGDVSVWTAQQAAGVYNTGFGRLITPYYVTNLFVIPAIIIATFKTFTDKIEKNKYIIFMILSILLSIICGNALPFDVYLLIMTPLFFFFHVIMSGLIYATLEALNLHVGYSFTGQMYMASPGSLLDLLTNIRNTNIEMTIIKVLGVGLVFGIIYFFILHQYYESWCLDFLGTGKKDEYVDNFIKAVGGLDNIRKIYASPTKIILQAEDSSLLNFRMMKEQGVYKVVEGRTTYDICYGAISYLLAKEVNKRIEQESQS